MVRYFMRFSYIGTPFSGVQRQFKQRIPTICDALEHSILVHSWLRPGNAHEAKLRISSRTDAGVHAFCNTAHIDLRHRDGSDKAYSTELMKLAINKSLHDQSLPVRILDIRTVSPQFHCRLHALGREYVYRILMLPNQPTLMQEEEDEENDMESTPSGNIFDKSRHLPLFEWKRSIAIRPPLNLDTLREAARMLEGTHNFETFTTKAAVDAGKNMIRDISSIQFEECPGILRDIDVCVGDYTNYRLSVRGKSFLHRQVRKMGGAILAAAKGVIGLEDIKFMLDNPDRQNWNSRLHVLPSDGLYLKEVLYDENDFDNPRIFEKPVVASAEEDVICDENDDEEEDNDRNTHHQEETFKRTLKSNYRLPYPLARNA